jgi:hypothetical protein
MKGYHKIGVGLILVFIWACSEKKEECTRGQDCYTDYYWVIGQLKLLKRSYCHGATGSDRLTKGCRPVETRFLGITVSRGCEACNPNATTQSISLSLQGNPTCPVTTTHSHTFETPGCWCTVPFVGRRCCYCGGGLCYTTQTWTTTDYVPAPAYGACP